MARTKRAARKHRATDPGNLHANRFMSTTTQPGRVTDSYRPGQERDGATFDDQPIQYAAETEPFSKRRKAADGDFYRPPLGLRPRPPDEPPLETDAGHNVAALGRRRSPPSTTPRSRKLQKFERKKIRLATIQSKIQSVQRQLGGRWVNAQLRLEMERLLAGYQADLKSWHDRDSKNGARKRYNVIRLRERNRSQKALNKARATENALQKALTKARANETALWSTLSTNRSQLKDVLVTVSDNEEEGGVLLTEASTNETHNDGVTEEQPSVQSTKSSGLTRQAYGKHSEIIPDPPRVKLRGLELEKILAEAKHQVHIAEVDINYCHFAPLDQQYICLFQTDDYGRIVAGGKKRRDKPGRPNPDPEKDLQKDIEAGILRTNIGTKPPLWDEIEEKMQAGLFNGLTDTLGLGVDEHSLTEVGGKVDALERAMGGSSLKRKHSWMNDEIAPEDLDTETESDSDNDNDEYSD